MTKEEMLTKLKTVIDSLRHGSGEENFTNLALLRHVLMDLEYHFKIQPHDCVDLTPEGRYVITGRQLLEFLRHKEMAKAMKEKAEGLEYVHVHRVWYCPTCGEKVGEEK